MLCDEPEFIWMAAKTKSHNAQIIEKTDDHFYYLLTINP